MNKITQDVSIHNENWFDVSRLWAIICDQLDSLVTSRKYSRIWYAYATV